MLTSLYIHFKRLYVNNIFEISEEYSFYNAIFGIK